MHMNKHTGPTHCNVCGKAWILVGNTGMCSTCYEKAKSK